MERPISKKLIFQNCAARFKDLIYIIAKDKGLAEDDIEHSRFIAFYQMKFAHPGDVNWNSTAICVAKRPAEKMVAIGEDGEVFVYVGGNSGEETIKPAPNMIRGAGVVDGLAYACGMKRQVYKREAEDSWVAMHATPPKPKETAGFEAIAGFQKNEIYAVGWNGEIWEWNGKKWIGHTTPTNVTLTAVVCAEDDNVYVCGQNGVLLRGRHNQWSLIELADFTDDFWDLRWFDNQLYLATMTGLYIFDGTADVTPVDFGDDAPQTCYKLSDAEGVLWSVGASDIFSFDGSTWTRVD